MHFLIANGRERSHDHIEAFEPRPTLDVVEPGHADERQHGYCDGNAFQIAKGSHGSSCQPSAFSHQLTPGAFSDATMMCWESFDEQNEVRFDAEKVPDCVQLDSRAWLSPQG
jgi:hypothetical protein